MAHAADQARPGVAPLQDPQTRYERFVETGQRNLALGSGVGLDVAYAGVRVAHAHRLYQATRQDPAARAAALGSEALLIGSNYVAPEGYRELRRFDDQGLVLLATTTHGAPRAARRIVGVEDLTGLVGALRRPDLDLAWDAIVYGADAVGGPAVISELSRTAKHVAFTVTADAPRLVWTPDTLTPAWSVTLDGEPAEPLFVHGALRGVVVPAGTHRVVWSYADTAIGKGLAASGLGLVLGWARARRRRRKR